MVWLLFGKKEEKKKATGDNGMCSVTVSCHFYDKLLIWQVWQILLSKPSSPKIPSHSHYSSGLKTCISLGTTRSHLCFTRFRNKTSLYCPTASNGLGYQQVSFCENVTCRRAVGQPHRTQITDRTMLDNGGNEEEKGVKFSNPCFWRHFPTQMFMNPGVNGPLVINFPQILTGVGGSVCQLWYYSYYLDMFLCI